MERPSPEPPFDPLRPSSGRLKRSKTRGTKSAGNPGPRSVTERSAHLSFFVLKAQTAQGQDAIASSIRGSGIFPEALSL